MVDGNHTSFNAGKERGPHQAQKQQKYFKDEHTGQVSSIGFDFFQASATGCGVFSSGGLSLRQPLAATTSPTLGICSARAVTQPARRSGAALGFQFQVKFVIDVLQADIAVNQPAIIAHEFDARGLAAELCCPPTPRFHPDVAAVIIPAVPPYSSMTMAIRCRCCWKLVSRVSSGGGVRHVKMRDGGGVQIARRIEQITRTSRKTDKFVQVVLYTGRYRKMRLAGGLFLHGGIVIQVHLNTTRASWTSLA